VDDLLVSAIMQVSAEKASSGSALVSLEQSKVAAVFGVQARPQRRSQRFRTRACTSPASPQRLGNDLADSRITRAHVPPSSGARPWKMVRSTLGPPQIVRQARYCRINDVGC